MTDISENPYELARDSVCVSAEIQGFLEKKGILGSRAKIWCSLQGSTLYLQKKQGDVVNTIDLTESHQVRQLASDSTGTQFEICIKKKSHAFICPTRDDCTAWIKALVAAMARKNSTERNSTFWVDSPDHVDDINVYSSVNECEVAAVNGNSNDTKQQTPPKVSEYADPYDAKKPSKQVIENDYCDVGDIQAGISASGAAPMQTFYQDARSIAANQSTGQVHDDVASEVANPPDKSTEEQESYVDAYSMVKKVRNTSAADAIGENYSLAKRMTDMDQTHTDVTSSPTNSVYSDAKIVREKLQNIPPLDEEKLRESVRKNSKTGDDENDGFGDDDVRVSIRSTRKSSKSEGGDGDDDDDPFQSLMAALHDDDTPSLPFNHPLTEEDWEPVEALKEYLNNNQATCRTSYHRSSATDDPVTNLKLYLQNLNLPS